MEPFESRFFFKPSASNPTLYGSFFFAFDDDTLDRTALKALDELQRFFSPLLLKNRISFWVLGYADKIGDSTYNTDLSLRRATRVKSLLDQRLMSPNCTSTIDCMFGEFEAAQHHPSDDDRAYDRRVEVHASYTPLPTAIAAPIAPPQKARAVVVPPPMAWRTVKRFFSKWETERVAGDPDTKGDVINDIRKGITTIIAERVAGGTDDDWFQETWGNESLDAREKKQVLADYEVFQVFITLSYKIDAGYTSITNFWSAEIEYVWGAAMPYVSVMENRKIVGMDDEGKQTFVTLANARQSNLLNPR